MANDTQNTDPTTEDSGVNRESITNSDEANVITNQDAAGNEDESQRPKTTSTQGNMGDGAGIRGDYGNSDQTNGMEGEDGADMRRAAEAGGESENSGR
ncbi:hypothetical protein H8B13_07895 [Hymenobacter sp. BT188]|uniref:hypothetical protein n=1 Tax=Hymenobacter sp. BT188 TaxID=2763504 RepID=UPI001650F76E|nr:hypothetical protein [Hymenobacter sp. BT188]MBC6606736.1 hypothetical protein [Hymenobacter sp. BT188]